MANTKKTLADLLEAKASLERQIRQRQAQQRADEERARTKRWLALGKVVDEAGLGTVPVEQLGEALRTVRKLVEERGSGQAVCQESARDSLDGGVEDRVGITSTQCRMGKSFSHA